MPLNKDCITFKLATLRSKTGIRPIKCQIRLNNTSQTFHTGFFCNPDFWFAKKPLYIVKNDKKITNELTRIKTELSNFLYSCTLRKEAPTAQQLYKNWLLSYGKVLEEKKQDIKGKGKIMEDVFNEWIENFKLKVSTGKRAKTTLIQWEDYGKKLIKYFGERELDTIKYGEYDKIIYHFETALKLHINTSAHLFKFLKRILRYAVSCDYMRKNPFETIFVDKTPPKKIYLNTEQFYNFEKAESPTDEHQESKDVFLFCAYTGLSYADYINLTNNNLITYKGKEYILIPYRQKSPIMRRYGKSFIPIHSKLKKLIKKYGSLEDLPCKDKVNHNINRHLKYFWGKCEISPKCALKHSRHTFINYANKTWGLHKDTLQIIVGHSDKNTRTLDEHYLDVNLETLAKHLEHINGFWD